MPEPKPATASPKPKRKWWVRCFRGMLWLLLFLAIAHRPLILIGGPALARALAKSRHLDVSLKLSGSIFSNLTVSQVKAMPTGGGPTPVESITIDRLRFDYNLWRLVRDGVGWFVESYEIHHADLRFVALPSKTKEERESKKSIAETLRTVLTQPAAYSDRVLIEDFNLRVTSPKAVTEISGLNLLLHPEDPGYMRIERIQIPGLPTWEKLESETSYVHRNLYQKNLRLTPDLLIEELNFDVSQRAEGIGSITLKAQAFGGEANVALTGKELPGEGEHLPDRYTTNLKVRLRDVGVRAAVKYFSGGDVPFEKLGQLDIDFDGDPEKPRTWEGTTTARVDNLDAGNLKVPEITVRASFQKGLATLNSVVAVGQNKVSLNANVQTPELVSDWLASEVDGTLAIEVPALDELVGSLTKKQGGGTVSANGKFGLRSKVVSANLELKARDAWFDRFVLESVDSRINGSRPIDPQEKRPLAGLKADIKLESKRMRVGTFTVDSALVDATILGGQVNVREFGVKRGVNFVHATIDARLPDDLSQTEQITGSTTLDIQVPALAEFGISAGDHIVGGALHTSANITAAGRKFTGDVNIDGGDFSLGDFKTGPLAGKIQLTGDTIEVRELSLLFRGSDRLVIQGRTTANPPHVYQGAVQLGFKDLAVLKPLLAAFKIKESVHGSLKVNWKGDGVIEERRHRGEPSVELKGGAYGKIKIDEVLLAGSYGSSDANANLRIVMGSTKLSTQIRWAEQWVKLRDINLLQGEQRALTGEIDYSLESAPEKPFDALRQPLRVSLHTDRLDIEKILASLDRPAPAAGQVTMDLAAAGTVVRPEIELSVAARALKAKAAANYDPAELDLKLTYQPGALVLNATAKQPLIQPLTIKASAPLDLERVINEKKLPSDLPVDASVKLPPSSLAVLTKVSTQVRRIDGTASIDVRLGGTVEKPVLSGLALISIKEARLTNENVPGIGKFDARLVFAEDTLRFEQFRGEVGGGNFDLGGSVKLVRLDDPAFDLRLQAKEVLVKRDDSITIRSDADVKVGGTLKAGTLTGEIAITQSRFFKEIDILPIGLPGKPKPAPKSAPSEPSVVLPPPLDKWKIDLRIITRPKDPFLVRGNVANGSVSIDVRVGNTGSQPWLDGAVNIDQFTGNLPFSTLTVEGGHVYFTQNDPLRPVLDIQAQSRIRDYTVTAYIFGSAYQPQITFSSEPPLPHADIISLLATGSTTSDISGNADVLASRAALLALQSIWRKVFKPKKGAPLVANKRDGKGNEAFRDRFDLELG
ncbi:MAG TPA: translocation/assembly module TamB domain-containing protein, partial [Chthoniobacteraceae bacterium]|nr:translocation/assembly module TamB domain-containing protein [Chthoniobacteraceae bacterium]